MEVSKSDKQERQEEGAPRGRGDEATAVCRQLQSNSNSGSVPAHSTAALHSSAASHLTPGACAGWLPASTGGVGAGEVAAAASADQMAAARARAPARSDAAALLTKGSSSLERSPC